jgi:ATPase subunit of ABC transporter with duplicated ATPase domains
LTRSRGVWPSKKSPERGDSDTSRELEWIRCRLARQAKGKAGLNAYDLLKEEASGRSDGGDLHRAGPRLGDVVVEARGLKSYGDNVLIDGLDFALPQGGIVGVIGPNGPVRPRCSG